MTIGEAIENVGARVAYTHPATGTTEPGIIRSVDINNRGLVNVQYGPDIWATHPANLELRSK
ncbi:hypothetical protein [Rhodococcus globerulus]|uniref:Uncharacterized protein n=1 Tax=Rhodococcus globerulus TaxID=33008 RepID=A0ABU4C3L9_RHOGO|nr:hypothetical protein [Rhodococcus globerulus]MDV6271082.1 hypothetical protein [Rhodococcus globerulus]